LTRDGLGDDKEQVVDIMKPAMDYLHDSMLDTAYGHREEFEKHAKRA
jgi:hypothetical protein